MSMTTLESPDPAIGRFRRSLNPVATVVFAALVWTSCRPASAGVTADQVQQAIAQGVEFLKRQQREDGSWSSSQTSENGQDVGLTSLVTLALLTAGEPADSPVVAKALAHVRGARADGVARTYSVALQTIALVLARGGT